MTLDEIEIRKVRAWTGERVPPGGEPANTNFTDEQIVEIAADHDYLEGVAAEMFRHKAALAMEDGLEEKSVGSEKLKFTKPKDLAAYYHERADYYEGLIPIASDEGSRILEQVVPDVLNADSVAGVDLSRLTGFHSEEVL